MAELDDGTQIVHIVKPCLHPHVTEWDIITNQRGVSDDIPKRSVEINVWVPSIGTAFGGSFGDIRGTYSGECDVAQLICIPVQIFTLFRGVFSELRKHKQRDTVFCYGIRDANQFVGEDRPILRRYSD